METKAPSVKVLKQMSITRQDLEKSSERLADNLSRLQQDNAEQTQVIEERLSEVQKEQITTEQLLQSDWSDLTEDQTNKSNSGTIKKGLRREPTIVRQLRQWTTSDVIRWLEKEGLHKFILTFQRHHVKGEDLAEIRLPFLDNYDHISVSDKELLLSHVYELLRLESEEQDNLEQFTSPLDREKYMAARQISKEARRSPVIFLPSHNSTPSTSPSSVVSSPLAKLRKCSDPTVMSETLSGLRQRKVKTLEKPPRKKKQATSKCTLFELLGNQERQEVKCVCIQKYGNLFGLTLHTDSYGNLMVVKCEDNLDSLLGCRVLEMNGYLASQLIDDRFLQSVLNDSQELYLVVSQEHINMSEEDKWEKLKHVLTEMKDKDPEDIPCSLSDDDLDELKEKFTMQEELVKAKEEIDDLKQQVAALSEQLSLQTKVMGDMKEQRDNALRDNVRKRFKRHVSGETEYYKMTMESLNVESATKEQVTDSLKEIVKEASRQKFYLDRLISVVIEESPWILDQVDAQFDDNSLVNQSEEFC
ncbi:uncharacterized protein [Mytilus edulis]|uniref:uncharacterized protein n=1 Tax=Mytilus edulis TaxID=6550 RepID=UPI0039EE1130